MKRTVLLTLSLAATTAAAQQSIKPRPLGAVQATSKELLGLPTLARPLPNGSVIVNDAARRRLLLLNPGLDSYTVIADSTSGSVNGYGQRPGALIPYVADSSLFLDPLAGSFLVLDPAGKVTRVMSPPRPNDNGAIANSALGFAGFDAKGRMIYRTTYRGQMQQLRDGSIQMPTPADTAPLLRVDLDTRRADTVAHVRLPRSIPSSITLPNGATATMQMQAPLAAIDDWAVLSDGTIAIVRGRDYHVDFIAPDGSKRASDKIAFDWKRLSDDDKFALIDSITKARAAGPAGMAGGGPTMVFSMGAGGGGERIAMGGGRGEMAVRETMLAGMAAGMGGAAGAAPVAAPAATATTSSTASGAASTSTAGSATTATASTPATGAAASTSNSATPSNATPAAPATPAGAPAGFAMPTIPAPAIADMPDYMPAFTQSSARADADANLWIRTTTPGSQPGNVVYDVVSSQGVLVDRVDVPKGMQIVGFAKGGIVYLSQREGYGYRILKASVR